ncbi:MAG: peptide ABC transporter substrate-binding protein [Candidatus Eremiobacteraeota bacterium]|nr:peptide ABC transporter substrate-binding protein [Candidatus Eremiobacteraeota bacterium]
MKRTMFLCALVLCMVCACARHERPAGTDAVVFNIAEDPHSLNPILAQTDDERQIAHLMFDMLLDVDARGRLVPALALQVPTRANGGISPDGRTIVYHLRQDVRWHDGAPLTANDVIFTWHAITDPDNDVPSARGYDLVDLIYAPDPYTLIVHLKQRWAPAVATLFTYGTHPMPVLPEHLLPETGTLRHIAFDTHPVGSGPYRLVRWERGERLVFAPNDSYYRGKPAAQTVVALEVPDPNETLTLLRSDELDWSLVSPAQRLILNGAGGLHIAYAPLAGFGAIAFNCRRPPFNDIRMRRAIAMAIDRRRLSRGITGGQYPVADSDQPAFSWAFDPQMRLPSYNVRSADRSLDALGWRRGPDGYRRRAGKTLSLTFVTFPEGDTAVRTAEFVQVMLRERGIAVSIKKVSVAQLYLPASAGGILLAGNFDLAYFAWRAGADPDDADLVTCRGVANYAGFCDHAVDQLETSALAHDDRATRRQAYVAVQRALARELPYDFLYAPQYSFAVHDDVHGFAPTPFSPTATAWRWSRFR